jgi:uncharacterized protein YecT (DUF1311 family)
MSIFYKNKLYREQYEKARFNGQTRSEARANAELVTLLIYALIGLAALVALIFVAIAIYMLVVLLNSPGIIIVEAVKGLMNINIGIVAAWFSSASISIFILLAVFRFGKNRSRLVNFGIYITLCIFVSAPCFLIYDEVNTTFAQKVLKNYAPLETIKNTIGQWSKSDGGKKVNVSLQNSDNNALKLNSENKVHKSEVSRDSLNAAPSESSSQNSSENNLSSNGNSEKDIAVIVKFSPSFDCNKATYFSEKIVCSSQELSDLDRLIASKYKQLRTVNPDNQDLKSGQINWIKSTRQCTDEQCVLSMYKMRANELDSN